MIRRVSASRLLHSLAPPGVGQRSLREWDDMPEVQRCEAVHTVTFSRIYLFLIRDRSKMHNLNQVKAKQGLIESKWFKKIHTRCLVGELLIGSDKVVCQIHRFTKPFHGIRTSFKSSFINSLDNSSGWSNRSVLQADVSVLSGPTEVAIFELVFPSIPRVSEEDSTRTHARIVLYKATNIGLWVLKKYIISVSLFPKSHEIIYFRH